MKIILKRFYIFIAFYIVCTSSAIHSQNENLYTIPDSLVNKNDDYLIQKALNNLNDTIKATTYFKSLLTRATINNDTIKKIFCLDYLAQYETNPDQKVHLIEKALFEAKNTDYSIKVYAYSTAGLIYHYQYKYGKALQNYIEALKFSEKYGLKEQEYIILNNIALLKGEIGKHEEAIEWHRKCLHYEIARSQKDSLSIMISKINLAESLRYIKKNDSATFYYNQIINNPFKHHNFNIYKNITTINEGINLFYKKNYLESQKLLRKGSNQIPFNTISEKYYILANLYLGKINLELKNKTLAENNFHKVDSLLSISNSFIPETRFVHDYFLKKFKKENEYILQLNTINKLVTFDSIISARKINTAEILHSEFDIPELLKNKEIVIQKLKNTNSTLSNRSIILASSIFVLAFLFALQYRKYRIYKKRFNELIANPTPISKNVLTQSKEENKKSKEINIDEKLVSKILKQLEHFEKNQLYTKGDLTINSLAKSFSTNTRYLSKIINIYKEKKFIHYINDLRIDYILEELKTNTTLQRYTIKSISEEAGFNTAESFATAFKKKTGLKPSYFIRNIKQRETN
jgi:AraC-like DNA-binding protein